MLRYMVRVLDLRRMCVVRTEDTVDRTYSALLGDTLLSREIDGIQAQIAGMDFGAAYLGDGA